MIGKITGNLEKISPTEVLVDVNGIAYEINIPLSTYDELPKEGNKYSFYTYLNVREDSLTLYGFSTHAEKELYKILITASGIGPSLAIKILSSTSVERFCEAVTNNNSKVLSEINGIGKKSAERITIELQDKIKLFAPGSEYQSQESEFSKQAEEAVSALVQLGFKYENATKAVKQIIGKLSSKEIDTESIVRQALQSFNK